MAVQNINLKGKGSKKENIDITLDKDVSRTISFDPTSVSFISNFYELFGLMEKLQDFKFDSANPYGSLKQFNGFVVDLESSIETAFGTGTIDKIYNGCPRDVELLLAFLTGVAPLMEKTVKSRTSKYKPVTG